MQFNDNEGYYTQDGRFVRFAPIEIASLTKNGLPNENKDGKNDLDKLMKSIKIDLKKIETDKEKPSKEFLKNWGILLHKYKGNKKADELLGAINYINKSYEDKQEAKRRKKELDAITVHADDKKDKDKNNDSNYPNNKYFKINMRIKSNKFKISDLVN